jgi:hypothetical protein
VGNDLFDGAFFCHQCLLFEVNLFVFGFVIDHLLNLLRVFILVLLLFFLALVHALVYVHAPVVSNVLEIVHLHLSIVCFEHGQLSVNQGMMLQRNRTMLGILHIHFLLLGSADPVGKLHVIGHRCR